MTQDNRQYPIDAATIVLVVATILILAVYVSVVIMTTRALWLAITQGGNPMIFLPLLGGFFLGGLAVIALAVAASKHTRASLPRPRKPISRAAIAALCELQPSHMDDFPLVQFPLVPRKETKSPEALTAGVPFFIILEGVYQYHLVGGRGSGFYADACYETLTSYFSPKDTWRCQDLFFDGKRVHTPPLKEDRAAHRYVFRYIGSTGQPLSLLLDPRSSWDPLCSGSLWVTIALDTKHWEADEALWRKVETLRRDEAKRLHEAEAHQEQRLYETALRLDLFPHYNDPIFLKKTAATYQQSLIARRDEILQGHAAFHEDRDFIAYLQERRPDLYERAIWQVKALALAEQIAAEPPTSSLPPPRPKLTIEEKQAKIERYRQQQVLAPERVHAEDNIARVLQRLDLCKEFREDLKQYDLEDDEKEQLVREFRDSLENHEEDNGSGQYKKL